MGLIVGSRFSRIYKQVDTGRFVQRVLYLDFRWESCPELLHFSVAPPGHAAVGINWQYQSSTQSLAQQHTAGQVRMV